MKRLVSIQCQLKSPKSNNAFGKFNYRKASEILEAAKPLLVEMGCAIVMNDDVVAFGERLFIKATATLLGENKEVIAQASALAEMDVAKHSSMSRDQVTGTASSYARKYALCGLLAIDDSSVDPDDPLVRMKDVKARIELCKTNKDLDNVIRENIDLKDEKEFANACKSKRQELTKKQEQQ